MFTQGTIVTSIRSRKYYNCFCYGIVVSARCDIANDKIAKIYYIEALDLESWIFSDVGFSMLVSSSVNTIADKLNKLCYNNDLEWDVMKNFSIEEFNRVVDEEMGGAESPKAKEHFEKYKTYTDIKINIPKRKEILKDLKKTVIAQITDLVNGKYAHFAYVPPKGIENPIKNGLVIDLQELDYFDLDTVDDLINSAIDCQNTSLGEDKKIAYNQKFILDDEPGYAIGLCNIMSPWIEYVMQRFANVFTRIGVDSPCKNEIAVMIEEIFE